ncbi:MAG TPA: serine hydrolase domain-containing protein, partial [Gemmatimonadaceae bacterium]
MIRASRLASVSLLAAFATAAAQQPTQQAAPQPSTITAADYKPKADSLIRAYLAETQAPSAAFAVIRGKDTLAYGAHGMADIAGARAATAANIYEIGSITKQFTSSAIMRLVEQGKVKLDDDMSKYIPQFPLQGNKVSIRQLLNHTSGIHSYTASPEWQKTWGDPISPDAIINFVAKDTFDFKPGTGYRYNNTGYVMLGMVIEKVTGQKYADHLAAQFFKPLGLTHTSYCPSKTTNPAFAKGYSRTPNGPAPAQFLDLSHPFAAGALCSTVGDLVKWERALMSGKVV